MSNETPPEQRALDALNTARDELLEIDANPVLIKMLDEVIEYAEEQLDIDDDEEFQLDFDEDDDF